MWGYIRINWLVADSTIVKIVIKIAMYEILHYEILNILDVPCVTHNKT